ncbi:hypothetical protein CIB96_005082, partial [Salmonella enterica subsp. enterica serovar Gaminara]|nr:hypothetical protein [Salmonella enterica subsp. enterica serovar Gaminara]
GGALLSVTSGAVPPFKSLSSGLIQPQPAWLSRDGEAFRDKFFPAIPQASLDRKKLTAHPGHLRRAVPVYAPAAKVLKRVKVSTRGNRTAGSRKRQHRGSRNSTGDGF